MLHARSLHCTRSLLDFLVSVLSPLSVLPKIRCPVNILVVLVDQTTANLSTTLLIRRCLKYCKFVSKVVFEEHVLNEAIYKISRFFTEYPDFMQSTPRVLALWGSQVCVIKRSKIYNENVTVFFEKGRELIREGDLCKT